jgi:hypothetical protein
MTRRTPWAPLAGALLVLAPLLVGFGLDRGELECERAAAALEGCCPESAFSANSCRQVSGCNQHVEWTLVTTAESECLRASTCDAMTAKDVCGRLAKRAELAGMGGSAPTIEELHAEDSLCNGL